MLQHIKGEWAGQPVQLLPWQSERLIGPTFGWMRSDGTRRFRKVHVEIPKKNGKGLALDTPVPTPTGWTTIEAIREGDYLFGPDGVPTRVTAITVNRHLDCYEVIFTNGERLIADADHRWLTTARVDSPGHRKGRRMRDSATRVRTTQELYDTQTYGKHKNRNHFVEMPAPLQLPSALLPVPPYVLGVWLGDGHSASAQVSVGDQDLEELTRHLKDEGIHCTRQRAKTAWRLQLRATRETLFNESRPVAKEDGDNLHYQLRRLGVLNNKHIPASYLRSSVAQRLALLQGLMDTDGTVSVAGTDLEYCTVSEALRDGVAELLSTLGIKFRIRATRPRCNGRPVDRLAYRIQFAVHRDRLPVFRLSRKLARLSWLAEGVMKQRRSRTTQIVTVTPVPSVATRCLMVDHPTHQFLVGRTMLPTHNSTIATGVSLYMLMGDGEPGAEVYNAAVDRFQTKAVFDVAMAMVRRSPFLRPFLEVTPSTKTIVYAATDSVYRALTAGAENKEGLNTHALICDELHAWADRDYWGALVYSGSARRQPLIFVVTTAGIYDELSIGWEQHEYARKVEENITHDWSFLPVMYAAGPKDKWTDPRVWERVNPCWGVTIKPDTFAEECREAQAEPRKENDFRRYRLNQWVQQATRWIPLATWDRNHTHPIDEADLAGRRTWVGVDVGSVSDLTAEILITDCPHDSEAIDVFCRFWVPEGALSENDPDREPNPNRGLYQLWVRDGFLRTTPGNVTDYDAPLAQVLEDAELANVLGVAIDQLFQGRQIATKLSEAGLEVTPFPQTFQAYGGPMKTFERLWRAKKVHHGGHPVLRWMADNTNVATNHQGLLKPVKPGPHSPRKIDGITALCMAIDQRDRADPEDDGTSRYETEGVRSV